MAQVKPILTTHPGPRFEQCKHDALKLLDRAAVEWSHGDPSDPDPKQILAKIIALFVKERFLRPPHGAG